MTDDDVLRGVRAAREAFAQAHGFDPHAMVAALRKLDAAGDWPVRRISREDVAVGAGDAIAPNPAGPQSRPGR
jgi:hypothetical protein